MIAPLTLLQMLKMSIGFAGTLSVAIRPLAH
jgi:hypothetical protein